MPDEQLSPNLFYDDALKAYKYIEPIAKQAYDWVKHPTTGPISIGDTTFELHMDPKISNNGFHAGEFDIRKLDISDSKINLDLKHDINKHLAAYMKFNGTPRWVMADKDADGSKIQFDLKGTDKSTDMDFGVSVGGTMMKMRSPQDANDLFIKLEANKKY